MDPYDEISPVHPSSTFGVPHTSGIASIRDDQAMARTAAAIDQKRSGWAQKASRADPNEDSPVDKKQKRNSDQ